MFLRGYFLEEFKFDKEKLVILTELLKLLKSFIDLIKALIL